MDGHKIEESKESDAAASSGGSPPSLVLPPSPPDDTTAAVPRAKQLRGARKERRQRNGAHANANGHAEHTADPTVAASDAAVPPVSSSPAQSHSHAAFAPAPSTPPASAMPNGGTTTPTARKDVTFHAEMVTPGLSSPASFPSSSATPKQQLPSILKTRVSNGAAPPEVAVENKQPIPLQPSPSAMHHAVSAPQLAGADVTTLTNESTNQNHASSCASSSDQVCSISSPPTPSSSTSDILTTSESIIAQYQPVYPSWKLILTQLQQPTLWDRLFTHCTGRDLLCKIVQHSCGLLRCLLQLWDTLFRRLVQYATFRRIFFRARDTKMLLPLTQPPTSTAAVIAPLKSISVAASPATLAPSSALPTDSVSDLEPAESWVPPSSETSSTSSLSHRLDYISHTMYRSRQVLRLGRWLYDIPDVRESARELWYGHGAEEEKSMEQQESEEEWEEHERLPVVRAFGRRSSFEAGGLAKLMPHINTVGGLSVAGSPIASPFGLGGSAYSSNSLLSSSSSATPVALLTPGLRDQVGRGTFLFPLAAKSAAQGSKSAERGQQQQSSSINTSVVVSDRKRARSSSLSDLASSDAEASAREEWRTSNAEEANEAAEATEEPAVEEEDDEGMTLLEWTVGVIDLTNSLMGLIIDASDDVEFIASLGVLPTRVGEVAGQISSYLWLVSGAIDVAMCGYKLRAYRREMREAIVEQLGLLREKEAARVDRLLEEASGSTELSPPVASSSSSSSQAGVLAASHGITLTPVPRSSSLSSPRHISTSTSPGSSVALSAASGPYSMYSSTTAAAVTVDETAKLLLARPKCLPASAAAGPQLTLCTAECDVDCFHIEYLRFFRYLGELGLSLCGVLIDEDIKDHPLQAVLEASGLFSGVATFIKRGATHARSKKLSKLNAAFMIRDDAGVPAQENGPPTEHEQLYS